MATKQFNKWKKKKNKKSTIFINITMNEAQPKTKQKKCQTK